MRILHTNFLHGWGGQSNRVLNDSRALAGEGHAVTIAAPGDSELVRRARAEGFAVEDSMRFARGLRPLTFWRDLRRMRHLIESGRFDLIHAHGSQDSWVVALANRPKRLPVARTKHNVFPMADHFANRWLYGRAFDRIICISEAIVEQCAAKRYIDRGRLPLIHSAIDLDRYAQPDRAGVERRRAEWRGRRVVAVIGRLRDEKGHRFLFEAIARLRARFPNVLLVVAGDGSLRQEFEQRVAALGIGDHVRFLGFRTDVPEILAAADIFALPSLSEGLGTAAIEAAAAGRPIVASRVGGLPDIIHNGETGRLVEPGDARTLADALADLLADPSRASEMGRAACAHAFAHFTLSVLAEKTEAVYAGMIEEWRTRNQARRT
jgi:glycosyltransferase involved in cell wall biosynthesis